MNKDPRFLRSQKKLFQAIIELASELPLSKITVSLIAQRAMVHRSTVYEHADSPGQLLRSAIFADLDNLHKLYGVGGEAGATLEESCVAVLRYLEEHEDLFTRMDDPEGSEIRGILRDHFIGSLNKLLGSQQIDLPETKADISDKTMRAFTIYSLAGMHVGIYAAALTMPKPRSGIVLAEVIRLTSPGWWTWE